MKKLIILCCCIVMCSTNVLAAQSPGLASGIQAPDFEATNHKNEAFKLSDRYANGPVVLIFYRGGWCMFCNLQLQDYQAQLKKFNELNTSIIAVSVDKQELALKTAEEKSLGFEVVSNPDASLLELYNAVYKVPDGLAEKYLKEYSIDLQAASGRTDHVIAVPATYVIDQTGEIIFAHSDEDYKVRKTAQFILDVIKNANSQGDRR